jgi:hypothetical protein
MRLQAVSDTDSVAVRGDTLEVDSTAVRLDSLARDTTDAAASDTTDVETDFPARDAIFDELAGRSGFRVIEYRGQDVAVDLEEETVELEGDAQAGYGESVLDAQRIAYWIALQFISASEDVTLTGEGQAVSSDSVIYYDVSGTKGTIMDARTSFAERGTEWYVRGDATLRGASTFFVETGDFTSCELDEPHYYFKAGSIKVVTEDVIVAWPVTLYISEVPVIWLPFFAQDIRPGRRSGFLPPRFGINDIIATSSTINRSITDFGYYFAINEFMDAQTTVDWFSGDFTRLNVGLRYKNVKKFFQGSVSTSYSFGNSKTLQVRANHQHEITPVTNLRLNGNFVTDTRAFEDQSLDPRLQTQRIASDFGLQHRFPFASVNVSASSRQDLGTLQGTTDLTLPQVQATFTPVTLFRAPRARAGAFNNITLSGAGGYSRVNRLKEEGDDQLNTRANASSAIRIGSFGVSGNANYDQLRTTPFNDSTGVNDASFGRTRIEYGGTADYQVNLVGSTTLRPTVSIQGATFSSVDTDNQYIAAPARLRLGATLSSDVFGFLPGFGPFERIRHKVSPRFNYSYSPAVQTADSLQDIPGFPASNSKAQNRLSISLNQTFEAKLREDVELEPEEQALLEGRDIAADSIQARADSLARVAADSAAAAAPAPADSTGAAVDSARVDSLAVRGAPRRPTPPPKQRNIVLLGINSSSLDFDFAQTGQPALTTDSWSHRVNSDLLRGLSLNLTVDLFDGIGEERSFAPILSALTGGFTFSSARGLGGLFGLGGGGSRDNSSRRLETATGSRYRMQSFDENPDPLDPGLRGAGPWTLALTYSLQRTRESESREGRQSLGAQLSLNPTPNWRLSWRTNYNLTDKTFGEHLVALDRDLHRWMATFIFSRAPNGNFIFSMSVSLTDAPDLKFDYDQRTFDR